MAMGITSRSCVLDIYVASHHALKGSFDIDSYVARVVPSHSIKRE